MLKCQVYVTICFKQERIHVSHPTIFMYVYYLLKIDILNKPIPKLFLILDSKCK